MVNRIAVLVGALALCAPVSAGAQDDVQSVVDSLTCYAPQINPATMVHLYMSRPEKSARAANGGSNGGSNIRLTALTGSGTGNGGKIVGYTRILIAYHNCGDTQRDYTSERREWIDRFFLGKHAEKLLTIDAQVTPLDVKTTRSLASIIRDSSKKGEEWTTQVDNDGILLPYFRADRSTVIDLEAKLHSTRDYNSTIAADTLDIVQRAAGLINPTTALITTANKARFNESAAFVDTSVNGLLKVSIDEDVRLRVPLVTPDKGQVLAVITLHLPRANDSYPSAQFQEKVIGQWVIYTEPARPSMLDDVGSNSTIKRNSVTAAAVLNYLVDDTKTLREALSGVQSLVTARDALVQSAGNAQSTADDVADKARPLCRIVANEALSLGMTPVDAGGAAWAYLTDLALPKGQMTNAETGCSDVEFYPPKS